jgi:exodeoxyribonuclease VII small subunit
MAESKSKASDRMRELKFEDALVKMEQIVRQMEAGELSLEESLAAFSEGIRLSGVCLTKLNTAEEVIDKIIREEQGKIVEKNLLLKDDA